VIQRDNIFGIQFHPEKSHMNGMIILKNFVDIAQAK
jgi:glutamine amidotransferase